MKIELTQGFVAEIDDSDWMIVSAHKWRASKHPRHVYARTMIDGKTILMHRLLLGANGRTQVVDHRDSDGLNNHRANLRLTNAIGNVRNRRKNLKRESSQYKGVNRHRNKWVSRIASRGSRYFLGVFHSERAAAIAYNRAARRLFGEFARLNEVSPCAS